MNTKKITRKPRRLKGFNYKGFYCYSITICANDKTPFFISEEVVKILEAELLDVANKFGFDIICYCFMPDHLHILIQGKNDNSDLIKFIKAFKQITGHKFKQKINKQLWQISFYDHVIRNDENLYAAGRYIIENPVRKGLVEDYRKYPYSWCKYFDIKTGDPY